jgi:hypothetical protein
MAQGLKFRVLLDSESKEEVFRDILIPEDQNFEVFYQCIMKEFSFAGDQMASFYVSNDQWDKGHEISLMDMSYDDDAVDELSNVMQKAILRDFISGKDQKFILVYDFMKMWIFLIELIGIESQAMDTPVTVLSVGNPPLESSKQDLEEDMFSAGGGSLSPVKEDEDEDDFGFNDYGDDYDEEDLSGYNEYEY